MKVCGIELKGNDAIVVCLEGSATSYEMILKERKKINLKDSLVQAEVIKFEKEMKSFIEENSFDVVGIKARATKGRFSGGSVSFKMEGIIQTSSAEVEIVHGATVKSKMKNRMDEINDADVNSYQKEALMLAVFLLN